MIVLDTTTRKIQVKTDALTTTESPVVASWEDLTTTTNLVGASQIITTNTTAVDAVGVPGASTQRVVKYMSVVNADSVARVVTFIYNDNATLRNIGIFTLQVGDTITYDNGYWIQTSKAGLVTANFVYAGPTSGGSGAASFRALVAADIPAAGVDLTTKVTGVLPVANGGTNSSGALSQGRPIISNASALVESSGFSGVKTTDYTVVVGDCMGVVDGDNSGAGMTNGITLPAAGATNKGFQITVRNVGASGVVKVTPNAADSIDNRAVGVADSLNIQYSHATYRSTGVAGSAAGQGWVVENAYDELSSTVAASSVTPSIGSYVNVTSKLMTPGRWHVTALFYISAGSGTVTSASISLITSLTPGAGTTGDTQMTCAAGVAGADTSGVIPAVTANVVNTTTTYYSHIQVGGTLGTMKCGGRITAVRYR